MLDPIFTPDEIARLRAVAEADAPHQNNIGDEGCPRCHFEKEFTSAVVLRLLDLAQHAGVMREAAQKACNLIHIKQSENAAIELDAALAQREDDKEQR